MNKEEKTMLKKAEHSVIACEHVSANIRPIKMIVHNHDETWEFMCGEIDHFDSNDSKVIKFNHLIESDQSILSVKKIPVGHIAEREKVDSDWEYSEL